MIYKILFERTFPFRPRSKRHGRIDSTDRSDRQLGRRSVRLPQRPALVSSPHDYTGRRHGVSHDWGSRAATVGCNAAVEFVVRRRSSSTIPPGGSSRCRPVRSGRFSGRDQGFEAGDDGSRPSDENWIPIGLERAGWPREVRSSPIAVDESPAIGRTGELPAVVRVVPGVVDYGDRPSVRTFPVDCGRRFRGRFGSSLLADGDDVPRWPSAQSLSIEARADRDRAGTRRYRHESGMFAGRLARAIAVRSRSVGTPPPPAPQV